MQNRTLNACIATTWLLASSHASAVGLSPMGSVCIAEPTIPGIPCIPSVITEIGLGEDVNKFAPPEKWSENHQTADLPEVGMLLRKNSFNSVTGENYLDYCGDLRDEHHGQTATAQNVTASQAHAINESSHRFLMIVDKLAKASVSGVKELMAIWPATHPTIVPKTETSRAELRGGRYPLEPDVVVTSSLVVTDGLNVGYASLSIEGICVTRKDLEHHYPDLTLFDVPRPESQNAPDVWAAYGSWGVKTFSFYYPNRCLAKVGFRPTPTFPKAFPNDDSSHADLTSKR